jgi:TolA-binding protein
LNYERSARIVEGVTKDEAIRQLKVRIHVIEDEVEELNEQLAKEEERSDGLVQDLEEAVAKFDELDGENQTLSNELRVKSRELENAKVG